MSLLDSMDFNHMDDTGMYWWAAILTIIGLAASYGIAAWWQRSRDEKKKLAQPPAAREES